MHQPGDLVSQVRYGLRASVALTGLCHNRLQGVEIRLISNPDRLRYRPTLI